MEYLLSMYRCLYVIGHLSCKINFQNRQQSRYYYNNFTDKETEDQRGLMIDPSSQLDILLAFSWHFFCSAKLLCVCVKCLPAYVLGAGFPTNHKCKIFVLGVFSKNH